jgi:adenylyl-sulfate kinase
VADKTNLREFRFYAVRRSGHHGVIEWLAGHFPGEVLIYNDVTVSRGLYTRNPSLKDVRDCYVLNAEDGDLKTAPTSIESNEWETRRGRSERVSTVLVLRDPYNWAASCMKAVEKNGYCPPRGHMDLWKQHAREFVGETSFLPPDTVKISFNDWFVDRDYRATLSKNLGLRFTDQALNRVSQEGKGSSFDDQALPGQQMDILNRWLYYSRNPRFIELFHDSEVQELSERIFGSTTQMARSVLLRPRAKEEAMGGIIWLTGIPGSGKSTTAGLVAEQLRRKGLRAETLDADELRKTISNGLGWSRRDRAENTVRIGHVARMLARNGVWAIVAAVSPYRSDRNAVRDLARKDRVRFSEVYVRCPSEVAESRDSKGIWAKARSGQIPEFTGLSSPFEEPEAAEIIIDTDRMRPADCASAIVTSCTG